MGQTLKNPQTKAFCGAYNLLRQENVVVQGGLGGQWDRLGILHPVGQINVVPIDMWTGQPNNGQIREQNILPTLLMVH